MQCTHKYDQTQMRSLNQAAKLSIQPNPYKHALINRKRNGHPFGWTTLVFLHMPSNNINRQTYRINYPSKPFPNRHPKFHVRLRRLSKATPKQIQNPPETCILYVLYMSSLL